MRSCPPPPLAVRNIQCSIAVSMRKLQRFADVACALVWKYRRPQSELASVTKVAVLIVSDRRMAGLHKQFCGVPGTTDVMTFQHGEIVISADTAARQAPMFDSDLMSELQLYLLHGLLHLAGFDDVEPRQRKRMLRLQKQFWATLRRTSA